MATRSLVSVETLHKYLRYDPKTGVLTWRERDESFYTNAIRPGQCANSFNSLWAGKEAKGSKSKSGHRQLHFSVDGRECNLLKHRVAWAMHHGKWPDEFIDHIDGNPANNRIDNLRDVPMAVNLRNRRKLKSNTSGYNGVTWCSRLNLWKATAYRNGRSLALGTYEDREQAAFAAQIARKVLGFTERHGF